ncbi:MAG: hypothetical protein IKW59_06960 [Clostridia bacterium]|nr:hypothetical protein [Clostridia bacterium]
MTECLRCANLKVFDELGQAFTVKIEFEKAINPLSAASENFSLYDGIGGQKIPIAEALYSPLERAIYLTALPIQIPDVSCRIVPSESVAYLDGTPLSAEYEGNFAYNYTTSPYDVSVSQIKLTQDEKPILYPESKSEIQLYVTVVNSTREQQSKTLKLYLNDNQDTALVCDEIVLEADSETELIYTVECNDWQKKDLLHAVIY